MSTTLGFSSFTNVNENMGNRRRKNRTIKKQRNKKVEHFLNSMHKVKAPEKANLRQSGASPHAVSDHASSDDDDFGEPYENPNRLPAEQDAGKANTRGNLAAEGIRPEEPENFGILKEGLNQQKRYFQEQQKYYNQYVPTYTGTAQNVPYYSQLANSQEISGPKDELMKKLNYVVHLLEEQQDEKTGSVTEELVLYMFLGVFVIFVVDSFARSGKYRR